MSIKTKGVYGQTASQKKRAAEYKELHDSPEYKKILDSQIKASNIRKEKKAKKLKNS